MHAVLLLITSRHSGGVASNVVFVLFMVSTQALYGMSECVRSCAVQPNFDFLQRIPKSHNKQLL